MAFLTIDFDPYTVLLSIFIILTTQQIIKSIGKPTIQEFIWLTYIRLATKFNLTPTFTQLHLKKQELHEVNKQKRSISAQDEYAKWTKLNRKCDCITKEIQQLNESVSSNKATIDRMTNVGIKVLTMVPLWFFRVFARKTHLFYFSPGVFPWYVERVLAFPFFPTGAVGLTVWMFAVNNFISSVMFLITFPMMKKPELPNTKEKSEKIVEVNE